MDSTHNYDPAKTNPSQSAADLVRAQIESIYPTSPKPVQSTAKSDRPDPNIDRQAYNNWYYRQSPEAQQAEWDRYYALSNTNKHVETLQNHHVVSTHFAHEHVLPQNSAIPKAENKPSLDATSIMPEQNLTEQKSAGEVKSTYQGEASSIHTETQDPRVVASTARKERSQETLMAARAAVISSAERGRNLLDTRKSPKLQSITTAIILSLIISVIFYNQIVLGQVRQFISPASAVSTPVILDPNTSITVGKESRIIIPKINVDVPVVYDVKTYDESAIQAGLERGVVHYGDTSVPGENGNNVIVGHSSNNFFNGGKYKFAFVLLERLEVGDTFILHYKGTQYVYRINKKEIIEPNDFSLVQPTKKPTATLITCTPPGTSWKRLVIQGEQISPKASTAKAAPPTQIPDNLTTPVPGNAPSLWNQLTNLF